jgi:serine/threonine protein kinase
MPPEIYVNKEITHQFDLFSLGIIIMEIVTGRRDYDDTEKVRTIKTTSKNKGSISN